MGQSLLPYREGREQERPRRQEHHYLRLLELHRTGAERQTGGAARAG